MKLSAERKLSGRGNNIKLQTLWGKKKKKGLQRSARMWSLGCAETQSSGQQAGDVKKGSSDDAKRFTFQPIVKQSPSLSLKPQTVATVLVSVSTVLVCMCSSERFQFHISTPGERAATQNLATQLVQQLQCHAGRSNRSAKPRVSFCNT